MQDNWQGFLALGILVLGVYVLMLRGQLQTWQRRAKRIEDADRYFSDAKREADGILADARKAQAHLDSLLSKTIRSYPWVAKIHGDLIAAEADMLAGSLRRKQRPALRAAEQVQAFKQEARDRIQRAKYGEYKATVYEGVFPFLADLFEGAEVTELVAPTAPPSDSDDPAKFYLTQGEYDSLSSSAKNQLALDRYIERRKSSWEIGRDFERYVGFRYERLGYDVEYHGALRGLEDLGRDLIARKPNETLIIQCKYWSQWKDVHENAVFQLFGSTVDFAFENKLLEPDENAISALKRHGVRPVFVTSTKMSARAVAACEALSIEPKTDVRFDTRYPRIKCNVGKNERLYHLPFDQQYDRVKIEPAKGEFYALTTAEAEAKGFRRAFRWRPSAIS